MSRSLRALALLAVLFGAGCKKTPPEPMGEPDYGVEGGVEGGVVGGVVGGTMDPVPPLVVADYIPEGVEITVTDPGAEPRQELRFTAKKGQKESLRMSMDMAMQMEMMGMPIEIAVPTMILDMDMVVLDVEPNGNILYSAEVTAVDLGEGDPAMVESLRAELSTLVGLQGEMLISPQGESIRSGFTAPEGASPEIVKQVESINESAESMSVPLPDQAVGKGAKWTVLRVNSANGMTVVEKTDLSLVELDGSMIRVQSVVSQQLADANPVIDGMPEGASVQILSFDSNGTTDASLHLGELVPRSSSGDVRLDMRMRVFVEGGSQDMGVGMDLGVEMGPRP